jgi:tRNA threonylcarbamoyladenosine biosynthesis protein TsaE
VWEPLTVMSVCLRLTGLDATAALARAVSEVLSPGCVVLLVGDLGAGKTTFTKALAAALDVDEEITSPTFTIMQPYRARFVFGDATLLHLDAYRLGGPEALDDLGLDELLDGSVAVIEWGDLVASAFPDALTLTLTATDHDDTRTAVLTGSAAWTSALGRIAELVRAKGLQPC